MSAPTALQPTGSPAAGKCRTTTPPFLPWMPRRLVDYNAALSTICFMLFLGFADDVSG